MPAWKAVFKRELSAYFTTPVAYVFMIIFLMLAGTFTFYIGQFFKAEQADLISFFSYHPWLYLFLVPALAMRLWSEDRKSGTIELLLTLPLPLSHIIFGKFLAAWVFAGLTLLLTFPIWMTVNYLGNPDQGPIILGYLGSFLMVGAYLSIGSAMSAMTKNQVIAFVLTAAVCFIFTVMGLPMVLDVFSGWLPQSLLSLIASFSFLSHFNDILKGVITFSDILFYVSLIAFWLFITYLTIIRKREEG